MLRRYKKMHFFNCIHNILYTFNFYTKKPRLSMKIILFPKAQFRNMCIMSSYETDACLLGMIHKNPHLLVEMVSSPKHRLEICYK